MRKAEIFGLQSLKLGKSSSGKGLPPEGSQKKTTENRLVRNKILKTQERRIIPDERRKDRRKTYKRI